MSCRDSQMDGQTQRQERKYPVTTSDPVPKPPTTVRTKAQPSFSASPDITRNVLFLYVPTFQTRPSQNKKRWSRGSLLSREEFTCTCTKTNTTTNTNLGLASLPPVPTGPL